MSKERVMFIVAMAIASLVGGGVASTPQLAFAPTKAVCQPDAGHAEAIKSLQQQVRRIERILDRQSDKLDKLMLMVR